ncbi:hypothetical protein PG990_013140 [Apiospora arundinis]
MSGNDLEAWADQLSVALDTPLPVERTLFNHIMSLPQEVFDMMIGHLSMNEQAKLASISDELYHKVRPVMDGFVWRDAPLPLPQMMGYDLRMQWDYVKQAEEAAAATGHVACPWCYIIHSPLRPLYPTTSFKCAWVSDPTISAEGARFQVPPGWHPLMIYAFDRWSSLGLDTTPLREAGQFDYLDERTYEDIPMGRDQWNLKWVPGHGVFARWRKSELFVESDETVYSREPMCLCEHNLLSFSMARFHEGVFDQQTMSTTYWWDTGFGGTQEISTPLLTTADKRSDDLVVGQVGGCRGCATDFQAAWEAFYTYTEKYGKCHWLHTTTWFQLGRPDIVAKHDKMENSNSLWPNNDQGWLSYTQQDNHQLQAPGARATVSGFPDGFADHN